MQTEEHTSAVGLDARMLKAIGHPVRLDALWILGERVASPSQIAKQLDVPVEDVAYHVRVLKELDAIELVETKRGEGRRGGAEHYYRAIDRAQVSDQISELLPLATRNEITGTIMKEILRLAKEALEQKTFDSRTNRHLSWVPLPNLDEQGWAELAASKVRAMEEALEISARSVERLAESGEAGIPAVAVDMSFEVPPSSLGGS